MDMESRIGHRKGQYNNSKKIKNKKELEHDMTRIQQIFFLG